MEFGDVFSFKYKAERVKGKRYDPRPSVIVLEETDHKIYGLNLNFIPRPYWDKVITVVNNEKMKRFNFEERTVKKATDTQNIIEEKKLAQLLFLGNVKNRKQIFEVMDKYEIKSQKAIFMNMQNAFRIYSKNNIEGKLKKEKTEKYILDS